MKRETIENIKKIAIEHGGDCLSEEYVNMQTHLMWQCAKGHKWEATPYNVKKGTWCPYCAGVVKPNIFEIKEFAKRKGGECLSDNYINAHQKLTWKCSKSHIWKARLHDIKQGTWCPKCAHKRRGVNHRKYTLIDVQAFVKKLEGNCLSKVYSTTKEKLKFQCKYGHIFEMSFSDVLSKQWCPFCSRNISEMFCRICFEKLFNSPFNKKRPLWLVNTDGNRMELDGYNEKYGIAFEYQGEQHYSRNHRFHNKTGDYEKRIRDDKCKVDLCDKNNIKLIQVPYWINQAELAYYLYKECIKVGIHPKIKPDTIKFSQELLFINEVYEEVQKIITNRKGKLLTKVYPGSLGKINIECENGHQWFSRFSHIKKGGWCPYCAGNATSTIKEMQEIAKNREGLCLSNEYKNAHTKLEWQCKNGHTWFAKPHDIKSAKTWCPYCAGKYKTIERCHEYAKSKGGMCLSTKYLGVENKLKWKCRKGHIWMASPRIVDKGTWCGNCYKEGRKQTRLPNTW